MVDDLGYQAFSQHTLGVTLDGKPRVQEISMQPASNYPEKWFQSLVPFS